MTTDQYFNQVQHCLLPATDNSNYSTPSLARSFSLDQYSNSLSENLPPGQSVVMVTATDRDMPGTNNSYIVYSISDVFVSGAPIVSTHPHTHTHMHTQCHAHIHTQSSDPATHFSINASTGVVSTSVTLNYEAIQSYRITVEAADRGDPQRSRYKGLVLT